MSFAGQVLAARVCTALSKLNNLEEGEIDVRSE